MFPSLFFLFLASFCFYSMVYGCSYVKELHLRHLFYTPAGMFSFLDPDLKGLTRPKRCHYNSQIHRDKVRNKRICRGDAFGRERGQKVARFHPDR